MGQGPLCQGPGLRAQGGSLWNVNKGPAGGPKEAETPRTGRGSKDQAGLAESLSDLQGQGRTHKSRGTVHL